MNGNWFLGDFGSSTPVGDRILSLTQVCGRVLVQLTVQLTEAGTYPCLTSMVVSCAAHRAGIRT